MTTPHGWVDPGGIVASNTRVWHHAQVAATARVGHDCVLGKGSYVGGGSTIGDRVKIGNYANVFGATIADEAMICPAALLLEDRTPRAATPDGRPVTHEDWTPHPVTVEYAATVGAGATVAPGVTVGAHAMVALGAAVFRDVAPHALVVGNPARQVGWVCHRGHTLDADLRCPDCPRRYTLTNDTLTLVTGGDTT
jgi:UDP-2-acetamido-3-amino-2,3-dideoxy-glucuronate N-acetyltransferase